jgi:predicted transcriptional regulator
METLRDATTAKLEIFVAEIVSSYVRKNHVSPAEISGVINTVYQSLLALGKPVQPERIPAVPISQSAARDFVVCLDCGWRGQTLNRHLQARHSLNESDYRARWGLPPTHRLAAIAYSERRSAWAKQLGLGRHSQAAQRAEPAADQDANPALVEVTPQGSPEGAAQQS